MRQCKKCLKTKPDIEMVRGDRYKGGIRSICKVCHNLYSNKVYRERVKNGYIPSKKRYSDFGLTSEGIKILIENGYVKNEEEARRYFA